MSTNVESINKDLAIIRTSYSSKAADGQLKIIPLKNDEILNDLLMDWIK